MQSRLLALGLAGLVAAPASATIDWTTWHSVVTTPFYVTTATGTVGGINVTYGKILGGAFGEIGYAQCTTCVPDGNDYWRVGGSPFAAYDALPNLPLNNHLLAPSSRTIYELKFDRNISELYMLVVSLGDFFPTAWLFSDPFTIIDEGTGFFGIGTLNPFVVSPNIAGFNWHGVLRFVFPTPTSSLTMDVVAPEDLPLWSGFTIGIPSASPPPPVIPEPATWAMLIAGFGIVGSALRRRRSLAAA